MTCVWSWLVLVTYVTVQYVMNSKTPLFFSMADRRENWINKTNSQKRQGVSSVFAYVPSKCAKGLSISALRMVLIFSWPWSARLAPKLGRKQPAFRRDRKRPVAVVPLPLAIRHISVRVTGSMRYQLTVERGDGSRPLLCCHGYLVWQPSSNTVLTRSCASRQQIFPELHPDWCIYRDVLIHFLSVPLLFWCDLSLLNSGGYYLS